MYTVDSIPMGAQGRLLPLPPFLTRSAPGSAIWPVGKNSLMYIGTQSIHSGHLQIGKMMQGGRLKPLYLHAAITIQLMHHMDGNWEGHVAITQDKGWVTSTQPVYSISCFLYVELLYFIVKSVTRLWKLHKNKKGQGPITRWSK